MITIQMKLNLFVLFNSLTRGLGAGVLSGCGHILEHVDGSGVREIMQRSIIIMRYKQYHSRDSSEKLSV